MRFAGVWTRTPGRGVAALLAILCWSALAPGASFAQSGGRHGHAPAEARERPPRVSGRFYDVSEEAGITFVQKVWRLEQGLQMERGHRVNHYGHGTGVLVADVNRDGRPDILWLNQDGPNGLYIQSSDGTFRNRTASAGLALDDRSCAAGAFGDYDNDGWPDLYVCSVLGGNVLFRNLGADDSGQVRFQDVTAAAGVAVVAHSTCAVWVDLDADGRLDLYVGNQARWTTPHFNTAYGYYEGPPMAMHSAGSEPDLFFHNRGDGTFADWTEKVGVVNDVERMTRGLELPRVNVGSAMPGGGGPPPGMGGHDPNQGGHGANPGGHGPSGGHEGMPMDGQHGNGHKFWSIDLNVTDYDNDGWTDLHVVNAAGLDALYRNRGDGTLELKTLDVLPQVSFGSFGARWFDIDNDGLLDMYAVDMHSDMWMEVVGYVPDPEIFGVRYNSMEGLKAGKVQGWNPIAPTPSSHPFIYGNTCYINEGDETMREVALVYKLENFWPWGVTVADYDLDGWIDIFVPSGMGRPFDWGYGPNFFYLNHKGVRFREAAKEVGIEPRVGGDFLVGTREPYGRSCRAAASLDYNNDGAVDLVFANWNDRATLLENHLPAEGAHWVGFRLIGKGPAQGGASLDAVGAKVFLTRKGRTQVQIVSNAGGYLAQSDGRLVFGLGDSTAIDKVEVVWPGGKRQRVQVEVVDRYLEVLEAP